MSTDRDKLTIEALLNTVVFEEQKMMLVDLTPRKQRRVRKPCRLPPERHDRGVENHKDAVTQTRYRILQNGYQAWAVS